MKRNIFRYFLKLLFIANTFIVGFNLGHHTFHGLIWINVSAVILLMIGLSLDNSWTKWNIKER